MLLGVGQFTIRDTSDFTTGVTPPLNPQKDELWLDTSVEPPVFKIWNGSSWNVVNDIGNIETELEDIKNEIYDPATGLKQEITSNTAAIDILKNQVSIKVDRDHIDSLKNKKYKIRYIREYLRGNDIDNSNRWVEFKAVVGNLNILKNIQPTANGNISNISFITDDIVNNSEEYTQVFKDEAMIQFDLKTVREDIDFIHIWHYFADNRKYSSKVAVSEDGDRWQVIFDTEVSGSYKETKDGHLIPVNTGAVIEHFNSRLQDAEINVTPEKITQTVRDSMANEFSGSMNLLDRASKFVSSEWFNGSGSQGTFDDNMGFFKGNLYSYTIFEVQHRFETPLKLDINQYYCFSVKMFQPEIREGLRLKLTITIIGDEISKEEVIENIDMSNISMKNSKVLKLTMLTTDSETQNIRNIKIKIERTTHVATTTTLTMLEPQLEKGAFPSQWIYPYDLAQADFNSYREQTALSIMEKVSNGEFESFKTQNADMIEQVVENVDNKVSSIAQQIDNITLKVERNEATVDGIAIGSINYVRNSGEFKNTEFWEGNVLVDNGTLRAIGQAKNTTDIEIQRGKTYVMSCDIKVPIPINVTEGVPLSYEIIRRNNLSYNIDVSEKEVLNNEITVTLNEVKYTILKGERLEVVYQTSETINKIELSLDAGKNYTIIGEIQNNRATFRTERLEPNIYSCRVKVSNSSGRVGVSKVFGLDIAKPIASDEIFESIELLTEGNIEANIWTSVAVRLKAKRNLGKDYYINPIVNPGIEQQFWINKMQVERGTVQSDWELAVEDLKNIVLGQARSEIKQTAEGILSTVSKVESSVDTITGDIGKLQGDLSNINKELNSAKETLKNEITEVGQSLNNLSDTMNGAFKDGIIDQAEILVIKESLKQVDKEKEDLDKQYNVIYNSVDLVGTTKESLLNAKNIFDTSYSDLKSTILNAISDLTVDEIEQNNITSKKTLYSKNLSLLSEALNKSVDFIAGKKSEKALNEAIEAVNRAKADLEQEINHVSSSLNNLSSTMNGAFKDGIISEAETLAIAQDIKQIDKEKEDLDKQYSSIYNNPDLAGTEKSNLQIAKREYDEAHSALKSTIENVILDKEITSLERDNVTAKTSIYITKLATLSQRFNEAINAIAKKKTDAALQNAKDFTNNQIGEVNKTITAVESRIDQRMDSITSTVERVEITTNTTKEQLDNLSVGGRNLILNSNFKKGFDNWSNNSGSYSLITEDEKQAITIRRSGLSSGSIASCISDQVNAETGKYYTGSCLFKVKDFSAWDRKVVMIIDFFDNEWNRLEYVDVELNHTGYETLENNKWYRLSYTIQATIEGIKKARIWAVLFKNGEVFFTDFKLEEGNKATDWTPAFEDIESQIEDVTSTTETKISEAKSEIKQLADKITQTVTKDELASSLTQTEDRFKYQFSNSGNVNLIENSTGYHNTTNIWSTNDVNINVQAYGIQPLIPSGYYLFIEKNKANDVYVYSNRFNLKPSHKYAFSIFLNNTFGSSSDVDLFISNSENAESGTLQNKTYDTSIKLIDSISTDVWREYKVVFTTGSSAKSGYIAIKHKNQSSSPSRLHWSSVMLIEGENFKQWQPHMNEVYNKSTQIDADGITVFDGAFTIHSSNGRKTFRADSDGYIYNEWGVSSRLAPGDKISVITPEGTYREVADENCSTLLRAFGIWHESIDNKHRMRIASKNEIFFTNLHDEWQDIGSRWMTATQFRTRGGTTAVLMENTLDSMRGRLWLNWGGGTPGVVSSVFVGDGMSGGNYGSLYCGNFYATGTKNRLVETENYGTRGLNAIESAECYFEDFGSGTVVNGECKVFIEDIFKETIELQAEYHVFLTKYGEGDIYVSERNKDYFIVKGNDINFGWQLVAKQKGYSETRLSSINQNSRK